jgi:hypothetical protein
MQEGPEQGGNQEVQVRCAGKMRPDRAEKRSQNTFAPFASSR